MAIEYSVQELRTEPGRFYFRVEPKSTIRRDAIIASIANKTLVSAVDVAAVLDALDDEIVEILSRGDNAIVDDFFGFSLSLNSTVPITDPNATVDPATVEVKVNITVKNQVRDRVRQNVPHAEDFEKITIRTRAPQPNQVFDWTTQATGQFTQGGPIDIRGVDLDLPNDREEDPRNGVFFLDSEGTELRAAIYMSEGDLRIQCIVPTGVVGNADIIVRSDYGGPTLREGKLENVPQSGP